MKKTTAILLVALLSLVGTTQAFAQENQYKLGIDQFSGAYIDISIENLDSPGTPILIGQRFRIKADCVINIPALYDKKVESFDGRILTKVTDPNIWDFYCELVIKQSNNPQFTISTGDNVQIFKSSSGPASFTFFDEIARAETTDAISAFGGVQVWNGRIKYTASNGKVKEDEISWGGSFSEIEMFAPLAKNKTSLSTEIIELDGDEDPDEPLITYKRESSSSYLISVLNYRPNYAVKIKASKKGNKSYTFTARTDSEGDIKFKAKRNLNGYKLEITENGTIIASKQIST
jgi:hypothetical protein